MIGFNRFSSIYLHSTQMTIGRAILHPRLGIFFRVHSSTHYLKRRTNIYSTNLANHLRNMPHPEFMVLLLSVYKNSLNGVVGLQAQGGIVIDILQTVQSVSYSHPDNHQIASP
jgi:hypothetical protein